MSQGKTEQLRMLIADNDEISRKVLGHFLKPFAEVTEAADGDETISNYLNALQAGKPFDLVFLDNVMPGKQGPEVLETIRKHEQGNPGQKPVSVIVVTGTASPQGFDVFERLGISYYLMKPIEEVKLLRELRRLGLIKDPGDSWD